MADRFYTDQPLGPGEFTLDGPEAHHLGTVRRFDAGDAVTLFNGDGLDYPAEILAVNKRNVVLNIAAGVAVDRELPFPITIGAAMPKGDRGEFLIEKLTELGVTRFVPLITERTVVSPKESRVEKLQRIVIEASKQCGRNVLMTVEQPVKWNEFLKRDTQSKLRFVLHTSPKTSTLPVRSASEAVSIAVGPEGGFTEMEIQSAIDAGWITASMGKTILRVETAAIAAASAMRG